VKFSLTNLLSLYTLFQLVSLTVVTFNYKKGKHISNLLLSAFMFSNALLIAYFLFIFMIRDDRIIFIVLHSFGKPTYLLLMPILYLYINSLCYKDFHLKKKHLLHFLPYLLISLFFLIVSISSRVPSEADVSSSWLYNFAQTNYWFYKSILHIQIISYLSASILKLSSYRKRLRDFYSSIEHIDLNWCNFLLSCFACMWFLDLMNWILRLLHAVPVSIHNVIYNISLLINLSFTLIFTYKGLSQSKSFSGIQESPKYAKSNLKPSDCQAIINKLNACMKNDKPYLNPLLTVNELSKKLKIHPRHLSQAIHTCLNQNFYDLVNSWRINELKERLQDEQYKNYTLLYLSYEVGFNSKSVFNEAFKKFTGTTPKLYKQQLNPK
jgi:AraC-like DNA-binding protein